MRSGPLASCIFAASGLLCLGLRHRAQPLEAVDAGAVAVGEGDADRIVADRPYRVGSMFNGTVAGSSRRRPFISSHTPRRAAEAQVAHVDALARAVGPEDAEGPRVAPLEGERLGRRPVGLRRGAFRANAGAFLPGPGERRGQPGAGSAVSARRAAMER